MANRLALALVSGQIQEISASTDTLTVGSLTTVGGVTVGGTLDVSGPLTGTYGTFSGAVYVPGAVGSGNLPNTSAQSVVVDSTGSAGMSVLSDAAGIGYFFFGDTTVNSMAGLRYMHATDTLGIKAGNVYIAALTSTDMTVNGSLTPDTLRITGNNDLSLSSTDHPFQIGPTSGANMVIDPNEMEARNNGAAAALAINNDGGLVAVGPGGFVTRNGKLSSNYASGAVAPTFGTPGDVFAARNSTDGVYYFGESSSTYLYFDGAKYRFGVGGYVELEDTAIINGNQVGFRNKPRSNTNTINATFVGWSKAVTAGITIPNAVFAAGDRFSVYNNSSASITITQGSGMTLRLAGTATTGNRTLAQRGFIEIYFNATNDSVVWGTGVT